MAVVHWPPHLATSPGSTKRCRPRSDLTLPQLMSTPWDFSVYWAVHQCYRPSLLIPFPGFLQDSDFHSTSTNHSHQALQWSWVSWNYSFLEIWKWITFSPTSGSCSSSWSQATFPLISLNSPIPKSFCWTLRLVLTFICSIFPYPVEPTLKINPESTQWLPVLLHAGCEAQLGRRRCYVGWWHDSFRISPTARLPRLPSSPLAHLIYFSPKFLWPSFTLFPVSFLPTGWPFFLSSRKLEASRLPAPPSASSSYLEAQQDHFLSGSAKS